LIRPGDTVVQVGAPHDTLRSGRSRAFYFGLFAGPTGRAIVVEPDEASARALEEASRAHGYGNIRVVRAGAWKERTSIRIFIDDRHPASNFTAGSKQYDDERMRDYRSVEMPAIRIDETLAELGVGPVRLVSITTNGAEREIIEGMSGLIRTAPPYIAIADTGAVETSALEAMGYRLLSHDDRGRTFEPAP
jgi:FkbM family methyltransferase